MMLKNYQVRTQTYCRQKMKEKVDREETQTRLFTTLHGFLDTFFEVSREPTCLCDEQTAAAPREENRRKDAQTPKGGGEREERCRLIKEGDATSRKRRESWNAFSSSSPSGHQFGAPVIRASLSQTKSHGFTYYDLHPCPLPSPAPSPLGVLVCLDHALRGSSSLLSLLPSLSSSLPDSPTSSFSFIAQLVKLRIPFLWESWQIIPIFEKFGTIFFGAGSGK